MKEVRKFYKGNITSRMLNILLKTSVIKVALLLNSVLKKCLKSHQIHYNFNTLSDKLIIFSQKTNDRTAQTTNIFYLRLRI